ncbi:MAG: SpoIID/LytB domain-containing protein [Candidatus Sulfomarinibacteraceae bacterium]
MAGCASTAPPPPTEPGTGPGAPAATPIRVEPTPTPVATPVPTGPAPSELGGTVAGTPIRVLLERTSGTITLPQPGRAFRAETGGEGVWLWGPLEISGAHETAWQVGAWSSAETAQTVVDRLGRELGDGARVWRETSDSGLVRVRVRWLSGDPGDVPARLAAAGFPDAMRVTGGGTVRIAGAAGAVESGGEILLIPAGDWPTAVDGRRYRGRFRVRIGDGGVLLINELGMEDYLRGVVPVEMGPYQFPELEALKAQSVAARTYAVAHLGDHDDEGWDICDTPACQAYHGAGAEHSLSDRAIRETTGLIARFDGAPIDAMYTSTCGGHTEDASELFSGRAQPYLTGVACAWDRPMLLAGDGRPTEIGDLAAMRRWLARRALAVGDSGFDPVAVLPAVAELCGGEVRPLPAAPGLEAWIEALLAAGGFGETSPLVGGEGADRLVQLADLFGVPLRPTGPATWRDGWQLEAVAAVLELRGVIAKDGGEVVPHPDGAAIYPRRADRSEVLPQPLPLVKRWGESYGGASALRVLPGTAVERYRMGEDILALVVVQSGGGGAADRRSAWSSWRREKSWEELVVGIGEPDLERLEIVRRGRSGRVVSLAVVDSKGNRRLIEGFDVRRALDLPETLFEMHVRTDPGGGRTAQFLGRGWGHGVGLCQNGAYGLARAGMTFEAILEHYYTGIEVTPW